MKEYYMPEEKELPKEIRIFRAGVKFGLYTFAWWKDGIQYVGTCDKTLKQAYQEVDNGEYDDLCPK